MKTKEELLLRREKPFRVIAENIRDVIWILDLETMSFVYISKSVEEMRGYTVEEALAQKLENVFTPSSYRLALQLLARGLKRTRQQVVPQKRITEMEFEQVHRDGHILITDVSMAFIYDDAGKAIGIGGITRDVSDRKRAETILSHKVEVEKLISKISTNFLNLESNAINEGIQDALKTIGEFYKVDRSYIFEIYDDYESMNNTYEWCSRGVASQKNNLQRLGFKEEFPWFSGIIRDGEVFSFSDIDDIPDAGQHERDFLRNQGIKSLIIVPMILHETVAGFLGFDSVMSKRIWAKDVFQMLKIVGNVFCTVLERKKQEEELIDFLFSQLTKAEKEILELLSYEFTYAEIARKRDVHIESLYVVSSRIRKKLKIKDGDTLKTWGTAYLKNK
ncbi:MAG: PAS domain S-box protein [bacterium]|nr:PAS domain S-box protein [bacterium]